MKRVIKIFLLVVGVFSLAGCSSNPVVTDVSSLVYMDSSSKENIAYNLSLAANNIKAMNVKGTITYKEKKYDFIGEIIIKDTIKDSIIHLNYKNNDIYLKNDTVYVSYMYNNTNVIVKDSAENYTKEVISLLTKKGIKCNETKIIDVLQNKGIEDVNFAKISEKVEKIEDGFLIQYEDWKLYMDNNYLPTSLNYFKKDIEIEIEFDYSPVSIAIPMGYDLVNMKISSIKKLLKVENISDLLK